MSFLTPFINTIDTIIDRLLPNSSKNNTLKLEIQKAVNEGELSAELKRIDIVLAEAKSTDKWTSRARPGFLYVMYLFILMSIPMGILDACNTNLFNLITVGMQKWLNALPPFFWDVLKYGFISYVGGRSLEKIKKKSI